MTELRPGGGCKCCRNKEVFLLDFEKLRPRFFEMSRRGVKNCDLNTNFDCLFIRTLLRALSLLVILNFRNRFPPVDVSKAFFHIYQCYLQKQMKCSFEPVEGFQP